MTKQELERKIYEINHDAKDTPEEKARRVSLLNSVYQNEREQEAEAAKARQIHAEASLKNRLKQAYLQNPVATEEDFEKDFPMLKSEYLRTEAMRQDAIARHSMAVNLREGF